MVRVNTSQTDPDKKGGDGTHIDAAGNYQFTVDGARDVSHDGQWPRVEFDFTVLASDGGTQDGRKHVEKFNLSGKDDAATAACMNRIMRFFCAIGLYDENTWRSDRENGVDRDFDEQAAIGRQFCAPVTMRKAEKGKHEGKFFSNMGFDFFAVGDEEADGYPKNPEWINSIAESGKLPTRLGTLRAPQAPKAATAASKPMPAKPTPAAQRPPANGSTTAKAPQRATVPAANDDIPF